MTTKSTITLRELELMQRTYSLEAVGLFHGTSESFNRFTDFAKKTSEFVNNKLNAVSTFFKSSNSDALRSHKASTLDYWRFIINTYKYPDIVKVPVVVPDGFKGNHAQYCVLLKDVYVNFCMRFVSEMVVPFDVYLAKLINQPTLLESQTYSHAIKVKDIERDKKAIAKFFTGNKYNTLPIGKIYDRMKDIDEALDCVQFTLDNIEKNPLSNVHAKVIDVQKKINTLIDLIKSKDNNINPSGKVLNDLSELVFALAQQVEFYAAVEQLCSLNASCMINSIIDLKRLLPGTSTEDFNLALADTSTPEEVAALLGSVKFDFPEAYYNFISRYNGVPLDLTTGEWGDKVYHAWFDNDGDRLPLLPLTTCLDLYSQIVKIGNNDVMEDTIEEEAVKSSYNVDWLKRFPIAAQPSTDRNNFKALYIDNDPTALGTYGQIINSRGELIAKSFTELLETSKVYHKQHTRILEDLGPVNDDGTISFDLLLGERYTQDVLGNAITQAPTGQDSLTGLLFPSDLATWLRSIVLRQFNYLGWLNDGIENMTENFGRKQTPNVLTNRGLMFALDTFTGEENSEYNYTYFRNTTQPIEVANQKGKFVQFFELAEIMSGNTWSKPWLDDKVEVYSEYEGQVGIPFVAVLVDCKPGADFGKVYILSLDRQDTYNPTLYYIAPNWTAFMERYKVRDTGVYHYFFEINQQGLG